MKKGIILSITLFCIAFSNAQVAEKFRVGLDLGLVPANKGFGLSFMLEPKYNIKDNMNIGLRLGSTAIIKNVNTVTTLKSGALQGISSYTGTFDYYFSNGDTFVPFLGGGIGLNSVVNVIVGDISAENNLKTIPSNTSIGGLIRGGFESGKFRMALEFNILPKSPSYSITGTKLGDVSNSYLGIDLGFYVGGGKWGK